MTLQKNKPQWKRLLPPVLWTLAGMGLFILLVSAISHNNHLRCNGLDITIEGYKNEMFISEADIKASVENELLHKVKGCPLEAMNLRQLEKEMQKDNWVSKAQVFLDNQQTLHVAISERLPVARIFTVSNRSYYIDSQAITLPLSSQQVADVPVFTNMPDRTQKPAGTDSLLWQQIGKIGSYIVRDSFLLLQVGQVNVTTQKELEIYPVVGNHVVLFGTAEDYETKFTRLKKFDKQVLAKAGLNKYSRLDLRYAKQVVATLRGKEDLPVPELHISPDREMVAVTPAAPEPSPTETVRALVKPPEKKPSQKPSGPPKQDAVAQQTPKAKRRPEQKPDKKLVSTASTAIANKDKKIAAASSNKPDKKTIKQLPPPKEKPGLVEVDIHRRPDNNTNTNTNGRAKAVMPKKQ